MAETDQGVALLDEVMVAATPGELSAMVADKGPLDVGGRVNRPAHSRPADAGLYSAPLAAA